jgi:23S rRNA (guanosine2251-2'-O)-methyltransferase
MSDLIYGRHPVLEALSAGESVAEILVAEGAEARDLLGQILRQARTAGIPVQPLPRAELDRMTAGQGGRGRGGGVNHQGVVAVVRDFAYSDLPSILAIGIRRGEPAFILALDAVQDVHNLGNLLRTAEAVGVHGVLLPEREAIGVTGAVRKASAGAAAHLAVARTDLALALDEIAARGIRVVGLDAEGTVDFAAAALGGPLALVVGGEARGLRPVVARRCDTLLRLPMRGRVASLNAGVAGSVVLYEALRQRETDPQT